MKFGPVQGSDENGWFEAPGQDPKSVNFALQCIDPKNSSRGPRTGYGDKSE